MQRFGRRRGIVTESWGPLREGRLVSHPTARRVAERVGATPAQVILRWHLQERRSVIPKSVNPQRIAENFEVLDFELTAEDMRAMAMIDTGQRGAIDPDNVSPDVIDLTIDAA